MGLYTVALLLATNDSEDDLTDQLIESVRDPQFLDYFNEWLKENSDDRECSSVVIMHSTE